MWEGCDLERICLSVPSPVPFTLVAFSALSIPLRLIFIKTKPSCFCQNLRISPAPEFQNGLNLRPVLYDSARFRVVPTKRFVWPHPNTTIRNLTSLLASTYFSVTSLPKLGPSLTIH